MTQINNKVNANEQKIVTVNTQFQEALAYVMQLAPALQQLGAAGVAAPTQVPVGAVAAGTNGGGPSPVANSAQPVNPAMAATAMVPARGTGPAINNIASIMDRLLQVYQLTVAAKQQAPDPLGQLVTSMDLGMGLVTKVSQFMSGLKSDWLKEQRAAMESIKTDAKYSSKPKPVTHTPIGE